MNTVEELARLAGEGRGQSLPQGPLPPHMLALRDAWLPVYPVGETESWVGRGSRLEDAMRPKEEIVKFVDLPRQGKQAKLPRQAPNSQTTSLP